jgi:hypothetical protein
MSDETPATTTRHWAQVLAEMPDAKKVEDRQRLTFELLGAIGNLERESSYLRETRIVEIVEAMPAADARQRHLALGQAFEAVLSWAADRIVQLVGDSPPALAETVDRAAKWLGLLDEAMTMAGRGGFHGELMALHQEAGQAYDGYKAQQPATDEQRLALSFIPSDGQHGEPGK